MVFYSQKIFKGNFDTIQSRFYQIIWAIVKFISAGITALIIDKYGRRPIFISGIFGLSISLLFLTFSSFYNLFDLKISMLFLYIAMFGFSLGPAVWLTVAELLPERGISIAIGSAWIIKSLNVYFYPYLITKVEIKSLNSNGEVISYIIFFIGSLISLYFLQDICLKRIKNQGKKYIKY